MNCLEVQERLVDYLANETTPSERTMIQAHLRGCEACRQELAALGAFQDRLSGSLGRTAAQVRPAADAGARLQARLAEEPPASGWRDTLRHGLDMIFNAGGALMRKPVFVSLLALTLLVGAMVSVPAVRAEVRAMMADWFRFENPTGLDSFALGTEWEFVPLAPTYLPDGFRNKAGMTGGEVGDRHFGIFYTDEEHFVAIIQRHAPEDRSLPEGKATKVNGLPASMETGVSSALPWAPQLKKGDAQPDQEMQRIEEYVPGSEPRGEGETPTAHTAPDRLYQAPDGEPASRPEPLTYANARRLTWNDGEVQIEIVSDLPERQIMRIARSMVPAEPGEGPMPGTP